MEYRKQIYSNYHSTHVNASGIDNKDILNQQSAFYKKELIPYLNKNQTADILEIGCGFGSFIKAAKDKGFQKVEGIDLSEEQVNVAHQLGLNEVRQGDLFEAMPENGDRDAIVGIDIIEHFSKDELMQLLASCKAHLKPGGFVLFRTPNMDAPLSSVYAHADFSHEVFLNKSSALQLLRAAGFERVEVYPSLIHNASPLKEVIRKILWSLKLIQCKLVLYASGRTWNEVVFTPNLIIKAYRP